MRWKIDSGFWLLMIRRMWMHMSDKLQNQKYDSMVIKRILLVLLLITLTCSIPHCAAFTQTISYSSSPIPLGNQKRNTIQQLVPISRFHDDILFSDRNNKRCYIDSKGNLVVDGEESGEYDICLPEDDDLPVLAEFIVKAFGADAITLSSDFSGLEKALLQPAVGFASSYSGMVAYVEVLSGLRQRLKDRNGGYIDIKPPEKFDDRAERIEAANRKSLVLELVHRNGEDQPWDVVASVELRLQPSDAKIPFSLPWMDRVERQMASLLGLVNNDMLLQPYLSTLCVSEDFRGKGLGRALVHCVEDIASSAWGYNKIYLHVDNDNKEAFNLYKSEGYRDNVGRRWNPFWAGEAVDIAYLVKKL